MKKKKRIIDNSLHFISNLNRLRNKNNRKKIPRPVEKFSVFTASERQDLLTAMKQLTRAKQKAEKERIKSYQSNRKIRKIRIIKQA